MRTKMSGGFASTQPGQLAESPVHAGGGPASAVVGSLLAQPESASAATPRLVAIHRIVANCSPSHRASSTPTLD